MSQLATAAGARPMGGLRGFVGPDFVAVTAPSRPSTADWYGKFETTPGSDLGEGLLTAPYDSIQPKKGPADPDDPDADAGSPVRCDYLWGGVASGASPWLRVVTDEQGRRYVYPHACPPP